MIAIQNPGALTKGELQIVDAFYDTRSGYDGKPGTFSISGYGGALPVSIQNMPEQQLGAVYGSGDGSLALIDYEGEKATTASVGGLNGPSSSVFMTRNEAYVFAASQSSTVFTVVNQSVGSSTPLSLPGVYRVSVNPGGSVAMAFVQNSNYAYYPRQLSTAQSIAFSGGPSTWPKAAVDCEPQNAPVLVPFPDAKPRPHRHNRQLLWRSAHLRPPRQSCLLSGWKHRLHPELRPGVRRVQGVHICYPDCAVDLSSGPAVRLAALQSSFRDFVSQCQRCPMANIPIPGGASNALVDTTTMYVVGQQPQSIQGQTLFAGNLTVVNLANNTARQPRSPSATANRARSAA